MASATPPPAPATTAAALGAVHPEHIALCLLAGGLVAAPPPSEGWGYGFNGPAAQRELALLLLEEVQDTSSPTLSTLHALLRRLQARLGDAGTVLSRAVLSRLQALESPDDLVDFAAGLWGFLAPPGTLPAEATGADSVAYITTTSPLGLFLRRVRLGLSTLSLQGLTALVEAVQAQVQQTVALLQEQEQGQAQGVVLPHSSCSHALKDPAVLDAHLNTLLAAVQGLGACLPAAAVEAAAAALAQLQGCPTKLDYLRLATSLAHRDMNAALSALHKYFDSSGSSSGTGGALGAGGSWALPSLPGLSSSVSSLSGLLAGGAGAAGAGVRGKGQHQAALHNLAALQMTLGHPQEALAALQELLRLGQQQGDEWGLLHGLASLCRVMSASEGLQHTGGSQQWPAAGGAGSGGGQGRGSGWGLLDLRRTEQQLQLQSLLQRCLDSSRDMRAPHIAAFAAVALCRFRLQHASSGSSSDAAAAAAVPGFGGGGGTSAAGGAAAPTPAAASLSVQRMLLDVATLEHQAAIAAAAPSTPAVVAAAAAAAAAGGAAGQGASAAGLAARSSDLYNPTEAFGTGASSAAPGSVAAAGPINTKAYTSGAGWRAASAAVSQALATGSIAAAAALQLQGASTLAGVRCLMLLTGPGGAGVDGAACNAAVAAAAAVLRSADSADPQAAAAAASPAGGPRDAAAAAAFTGSSIRCEDVVAGWVQLVLLVEELQGVAAAQHVLALAEGHFPLEPPQQLLLARQVLAVKAAVQAGRMPDAWLACEEMQSLAPLLPQLGLELQLAAAEAHVRVLLAAGCCSEAHAAAAALFATAAGGGMQPQAVSALLLMAQAALDAGDAAGSLGPALSALLHCQALQLDGLLPEAVLLVAAAWQELAPGGARFVAQLLQQVQPLAYASGKLRVWADVEHRLGVLQLAAATSEDEAPAAGCPGAPLAEPALQAVRQRVAAAAAAYEQAGDTRAAADAWLLLAHVCNAAGHEEARNDAAGRWQQLQATTGS